MSSILTLQNIQRSFSQAEQVVSVLNDVNLSLEPGEIVGLVGSSGSGKSTLLHIAGLLDLPTSGAIFLKGKEVKNKHYTKMRLQNIGFVYQFHHLLPELTALENVIIPQRIAGKSWPKAQKKAQDLLEQVGLSHRLDFLPEKLSGGEKQRVAVARALANEPCLILADEPTGNLDDDTTEVVFSYMINLVRAQKAAALIATHDQVLAQRMDRVLKLHHGFLEE